MTEMSDGTYVTDLDDNNANTTLSSREYTVRHIETCLRCQAELVQYRKLFRVLHQMRAQGAKPPPGTVGRILTGIESNALMHYVARPEFWSRTSSLERGGQTEPGLDVASQVSANFEEGALFGMGYCNHV